jgi:hypothetical protein
MIGIEIASDTFFLVGMGARRRSARRKRADDPSPSSLDSARGCCAPSSVHSAPGAISTSAAGPLGHRFDDLRRSSRSRSGSLCCRSGSAMGVDLGVTGARLSTFLPSAVKGVSGLEFAAKLLTLWFVLNLCHALDAICGPAPIAPRDGGAYAFPGDIAAALAATEIATPSDCGRARRVGRSAAWACASIAW